MRLSTTSGLLLAAGLALTEPVNVPITASDAKMLGTQTDAGFANTNLAHDGSVNAYANGILVQIYMDSYTSTTPVDKNGKANITSFVSNSISYLGLNGGTPLNISTFGGRNDQAYGDKVFNYSQSVFPTRANETGTTAFWPAGGATTLPDNKTIVMFSDVLDRVESHVVGRYNTLLSLTVVPPEDVANGTWPPTGRPTPGEDDISYWAFWFVNEPSYGSFDSLLDQEQEHLYVFASDISGIKMARAPIDSYNSRTNYQYFNGSTGTYTNTLPLLNHTTANIINWDTDASGGMINSGTVYWSYHHNTYIAVILDNALTRHVWTSYSKSGTLEGPWSDIDFTTPLYMPKQDPRCDGHYNSYGVYNLHGYPSYDPSGKTLLTGSSGCAIYTTMDLVTFA